MTRLRLLLAVGVLGGCDAASTAVVENRFAALTVQKAWWQTTLFGAPVAAGETSAPLRTVPGTATLWALVVSDPAAVGGATPVKSPAPLTLGSRGDELRLVLARETVVGLCDGGGPLLADEAQEAARIFPGELVGTYDPTLCGFQEPPDAGP